MAAARLLFLSRLLKVAPTALLILLYANRSWCEVLRHDCLSMWLQAPFVNQVLPQPDGPRFLAWCVFATTCTRRWKHMMDAWDEDSPHPCGVPPHTDIQLHWSCYECGLSYASHRALMANAMAAHAAVSFASRFIFDVSCPCCLTLFHTRQRVHEHLVDGKRRCLHALAAAVEPASFYSSSLNKTSVFKERQSSSRLNGNPNVCLPSECTTLHSRGLIVWADGLLLDIACT